MKTVLLPTDGSETAANAIDYAIQMHSTIPCRYILLHTFPAALHHPDLVGIQMSHEGKAAEELLKNQVKTLKERYADQQQQIEGLCLFGFMTDIIRRVVKEKKADLIVMGTQGAQGALEEAIGSNTWDVIKHVPCPLLAVPRQASFTPLKRIVFATDANKIKSLETIYPLAEIALQFQARMSILHINPKEASSTFPERQREELESVFSNISHEFEVINHEDTASGIQEFMSNSQQAFDLLAMITRQRNLLESLWHVSTTRKLSLHSRVPLLALHDREKL